MTSLESLIHTELDEPVPSKVLVIVAHPDDIDFGAAGSVATFADHGIEVVYALVTDGDAGEPADLTPLELKNIRQAEQEAAGAVVGVSEIHWLGFRDGAVVADLDLRRGVTRVIRQVQPDLVITQSPIRDLDRIYASHPDHLATGEAVTCAVYPDARNAHSFPELLHEGLEPHSVPRLWLMANAENNLCVDITDAFDRKIDALLAHHSQNDSRAEMLPSMIKEWGESNARRFGVPGRIVESFRCVNTE